jgi:hypothetical protein
VVSAPEPLAGEQRIGVAHEVPVGKEEQAHDVERHFRVLARTGIYVSLVDIYFGNCHCPPISNAASVIPKPFWFAKGWGLMHDRA